MEFDKKVFRKILRNVFLGVIACIVVYWLLHDPGCVSQKQLVSETDC